MLNKDVHMNTHVCTLKMYVCILNWDIQMYTAQNVQMYTQQRHHYVHIHTM